MYQDYDSDEAFYKLRDRLPEDKLSETWENWDWEKSKEALYKDQAFLAKMAHKGDMLAVENRQKKMVRELGYKMLAVDKVSRTGSVPGVDGVVWKTSAEKMREAYSLTARDYKAAPMRQIRIWAKNNGRNRYAGIPTYHDRAMTILYGYTLAPVAEALADKKSFAFRRGRSTQDAHDYVIEGLKGNTAPQYVLVCDIKAYYSTIRHAWLLEHIPMDKKILSEHLKAGHVIAGELFPAEDEGLSEGSNLSPYCGNLTLDGLQDYIYLQLYGRKNSIDFANGNMVRFADDMVINCRSREDAEMIRAIVEVFLAERGLKLSTEKTKIVHVTEGFDFLARHYIKKEDGNIYSYPTEKAIGNFTEELNAYIMGHKGSQRDLITGLNKKLVGWASYYRFCDANDAFREVDAAVQTALLVASCSKHPLLPQKKVISKYWYKENGKHIFALQDQKNIRVKRLADVLLINHEKIRLDINPFIDRDYMVNRAVERDIINVNSKYKPIWLRQEGKCYYCGREILPDEPRTLVQKHLHKSPGVNNSAYIHKHCEQSHFRLVRVDKDTDRLSRFDVMEALLKLSDKTDVNRMRYESDKWKYAKLKKYFAKKTVSRITLTFDEIEKISGHQISEYNRTHKNYWYPRQEFANFAYAWLSEGYTMHKLDLKKQKVIFARAEESVSHLNVPEILTSHKIPDDAKIELEEFFEYIIKKYGICKTRDVL